MINKFKVKQFVHNAIKLVWGLQGKLASRYGKSDNWISEMLDETKETDFAVFPFLVFMQHISELSPDTFAMIDDYVRGILDDMRVKGIKGVVSEPVDTQVEAVAGAWAKFQSAYRHRVGTGELHALSASMGAHVGRLSNALNPAGLRPAEGERKQA